MNIRLSFLAVLLFFGSISCMNQDEKNPRTNKLITLYNGFINKFNALSSISTGALTAFFLTMKNYRNEYCYNAHLNFIKDASNAIDMLKSNKNASFNISFCLDSTVLFGPPSNNPDHKIAFLEGIVMRAQEFVKNPYYPSFSKKSILIYSALAGCSASIAYGIYYYWTTTNQANKNEPSDKPFVPLVPFAPIVPIVIG